MLAGSCNVMFNGIKKVVVNLRGNKNLVKGCLCKWAVVILIMAAFSLCLGSCNKEKIPQEVKNLENPYACTADIDYKGIKANASIQKASPGECVVEFSEPPMLKDMRVNIQGGKIVVDYKGFSIDLSSQSSTSKMIASTVISAIESAAKDANLEVIMEENLIKVSGKNEEDTYEIAINRETGLLASLTFPKDDVEVHFKDFRFINQ